jgi:alanyl-tRNA synthetase
MDRQRAMGKENWTGSGQATQGAVWLALRERLGPTVFTGYDNLEDRGELRAILKDGAEVEAADEGNTVELLLDRTPFYGEGGGQAGDTGTMTWPGGGEGTVLDTRKEAGDLHVHVVRITHPIRVGDTVTATVNAAKRATTRANHSAAHLAHKALHSVLGPHVSQKGQLVDAERMRFDFSHGGPLTAEELDRIEREVNAVILQNVTANTAEMAPDEAIKAGAVALFGENTATRSVC